MSKIAKQLTELIGSTPLLELNKFSKAKDYVEIGIDAEDYFRIKNSGKESK